MFGKLLKYEWRANSKLFGLLSLIALGLGLVGGVVIRGMFLVGKNVQDDLTLAMSMLGLFGMLMICMVLIGVYMTAVNYINYFRFYKHKFTDEGYLTFTLPVTAEQLFWSSFVNIMLWMLIATVVAAISAAVMLTIGVGPAVVDAVREIVQMYGWPEVTLEAWRELFDILWQSVQIILEEGLALSGAPLYYGMSASQVIVAPVYNTILTMACITVGSVLVKRMKLLLSVGIYAGFTSVVALLSQISVYVPTFAAMHDYEHYFYWMSIPMALQMALQLTVIVGGYFLIIHLMKKKLNLP